MAYVRLFTVCGIAVAIREVHLYARSGITEATIIGTNTRSAIGLQLLPAHAVGAIIPRAYIHVVAIGILAAGTAIHIQHVCQHVTVVVDAVRA
jgi:hypothetical protein